MKITFLLLVFLVGCAPKQKILCLEYTNKDLVKQLTYFEILRDDSHPGMGYPVIHSIYTLNISSSSVPYVMDDFIVSSASNIETYKKFKYDEAGRFMTFNESNLFDIGQAMVFAYLDKPEECSKDKSLKTYRVPGPLVESYFTKLKDRERRPSSEVKPAITTWYMGTNIRTNWEGDTN